MSTYFKLGAMVKGIATTPTAGGTTSLTATSRPVQQFTGTLSQTVALPDATTLKVGRRFDIQNRSTQAITVTNFGGTLLATIPADSQRYFLVTDAGTSNGSWQVAGVSSGGGGAGVTSSDKLSFLGGLAGLNFSSDTIVSKTLKTNPEEMGGNFWTVKTSLPIAKVLSENFSLNGFLYAVGGQQQSGNSSTNHNYQYNQDSDYFLSKTVLPASIQQTNGFSDSAKGYVVGGFVTGGTNGVATAYSYNDITDTWSTLASINAIKYSAGCWAGNSYNFVGPGNNNGSIASTTEAYDSVTNAWLIRLTLSIDSVYSSQESVSLNGYGITLGGDAGSGTSPGTGRKYNESSNSYTAIPAMLTGRRYPGASIAAGSILIYGGEQTGTGLSSAESYSDVTNSYVARPSMSVVRDYISGGDKNLNGIAYAVGGGPVAVNPIVTTLETFNSFVMLNLGKLKSSTAVPTSILAAALVNNLSKNLPIQVRTDGDAWKKFTAGTNSVLKTGESISAKFQYQPLAYYTGGTDGSSVQSVNNLYDANANAWVSRQTQAAGRQQQSGFSLDGNGYVLCGYDGASAVNENKYYNEITNAFTTRTNPNSAHRDCSGSSLNGYGYIYVTATAGITADTTQRFLQYSSSLNAFTSKTVLTTDVYSAPMVSLANRLWVQGGQNTSGTVQQLNQSYDDTTNAWTAKAVIGFTRDHHGGFAMNDKTYVIAGEQGGSPTNALETYNVGTDSWTHSGAGTGDLPVSMEFNCGFVNDGYGYTIGGYTGSFTARFYQFNPYSLAWTSKTTDGVRANSASGYAPAPYRNYEVRIGIPAYYAGLGDGVWVTKANMLQTKTSGASFSIDSYIYASDGNGGTQQELQRYDAITNSWIYETNFPYANQEQYSANIAVNGLAHRFGDGAAATNQLHYRYEPVSKVWRNSGAYPTLIYQQSSACLNGLTYGFCGNRPGVGLVTTNYSYSDTTDAWTSRAAALNTSQDVPGSSFNGFMYHTGNSAHNQYNDAADSWLSKTASGLAGNSNSVIILPGKMLAAGSNPVSATVVQYLDTLNVWATRNSQPASRYGQYNGTVGDTGYLSAGSDGSINRAETFAYVPSVKNAVLGLALEIK